MHEFAETLNLQLSQREEVNLSRIHLLSRSASLLVLDPLCICLHVRTVNSFLGLSVSGILPVGIDILFVVFFLSSKIWNSSAFV